MAEREVKNAFSMTPWMIAAAAGLVAFGVSMVIGKLNVNAALFIAILLTLVAGLVLSLGWTSAPSPLGQEADETPAAERPEAAPAAAQMQPLMSAVSTPDAVVAAEPVKLAEMDAAPAAPKAEAAPKTKAPAKTKAASAAKPEPKAKAAAKPKAKKADGPERLTAPRKGKADDLKEIEGIGPALEKLCNELGFWHFDQIANWSDADVSWVDANMKNFKGRIVRDKWVAQAKLIVSEGLEAFRIRAKTNDY